MNRPHRMAATALSVALCCGAGAAGAVCRDDPALAALEARIARQHFPQLTARLPPIQRCDASDFPLNVSGDFNPNTWHIRVITTKQLELDRLIVWHELGHAAATEKGETPGGPFRGHGPIWLRVMIRSGLATEAKRTAEIYPGLLPVYQQVMLKERKPTEQHPDGADLLAFLRERPGFIGFLLTPID